jgi:hypothetical protein
MANLITDDMLEAYAITCTWDELPRRLVDKYAGVADRLIFYFAAEGWEKGTETMERWRDALGRTRALLAPRG